MVHLVRLEWSVIKLLWPKPSWFKYFGLWPSRGRWSDSKACSLKGIPPCQLCEELDAGHKSVTDDSSWHRNLLQFYVVFWAPGWAQTCALKTRLMTSKVAIVLWNLSPHSLCPECSCRWKKEGYRGQWPKGVRSEWGEWARTPQSGHHWCYARLGPEVVVCPCVLSGRRWGSQELEKAPLEGS